MYVTYTMLLTRVKTAPQNVRKAIVRRRTFAGLRGIFLNEYSSARSVSVRVIPCLLVNGASHF